MGIRRKTSECERAWRGGADFRVVCPCQLAIHPAGWWRRAFGLGIRGAALLICLVAFAAFDFPGSTDDPRLKKSHLTPELPIFTTSAARAVFMQPDQRPTLELFRKRYFDREVPYGSIIYREAVRNRLPPELVAAMVHTESDFRPRLVSNKSAQGLMQIVPETARLLGVGNPFDPEENVAAGTRYYRYLLERFENETVALAAYNAGEGNVVRFRGVPPFAETRAYVARVNRRARGYREVVHNSYLATLRLGPAAH